MSKALLRVRGICTHINTLQVISKAFCLLKHTHAHLRVAEWCNVHKHTPVYPETSFGTELDALNSLAKLFKLLEKDETKRNFLVSYYVEKVLSTGSDKSLINTGYSLSYYHE